MTYEAMCVIGVFVFFSCVVCGKLKIGKLDSPEWYIFGFALIFSWWFVLPIVLFFYTINKLAHIAAVKIVAWYER